MVLVEDMVSRRHARITTFSGEIFIEDFGSTNGTFVNGEKITSKARLKEGDRILVGTNIIKLVHRDSSDTDAGVRVGGPNDNRHEGGRTTGATLTGSISGQINEVPLPDLLQLFSTSKKSGVLVIHKDQREAKVFLSEGRIRFAMVDNDREVDPYRVFYRIIVWEYGTFSLEHPSDETFENEIDESIESLMMEGMRIQDEIGALGSDVPGFEDKITVNKPLVPPLRSLTPELMDTIQLVFNYGTVSEVLNKSMSGDLETMTDLVYLIRNDYVQAQPS